MTPRELRIASGMTQRAFAEYLGVSVRTVEAWEYGRNKCPEYVVKLMEYKLRKEGMIRDE